MVCGHSPVHVCVWDRPDIPVIYTAPWSPGPYKNPWTSKDPWPALRGCSESLLRIDPWGRFSVTAWRTLSVFVQKKGIVQATTVKLVFSGTELTSGCNYLCECAAVVASLSDKCSVTHRQCWGSCCSITSSVCCVNSPVLRMGIYSVLVHIFMSISTFVSTERCRKKTPSCVHTPQTCPLLQPSTKPTSVELYLVTRCSSKSSSSSFQTVFSTRLWLVSLLATWAPCWCCAAILWMWSDAPLSRWSNDGPTPAPTSIIGLCSISVTGLIMDHNGGAALASQRRREITFPW